MCLCVSVSLTPEMGTCDNCGGLIHWRAMFRGSEHEQEGRD